MNLEDRFGKTGRACGMGAQIIVCSLLALVQTGAQAGDWPRWRGPDLNGISQEKDWSDQWPPSGPKRIWRANVATGFSTVSVSQGRVFTMGNRGEKDIVFCLDEKTGKEIWTHSYPSPRGPRYYDGGPSATPTVAHGVVYTLGRQGDAFAFDAATGKILWQKNVAEEIGAAYPEWGYAGSPFVAGEKLLLHVGTAGLAVDRKTGKLLWQTGSATSGYSTPYPFTQSGKDCVAIFGAKGMHAVTIDAGKILWSHPWRTSWDAHAADPIIHDGKLFLSSGYDSGGALIQLTRSRPRVVWENRNMRNHFNSCVLIDGHLYGFDGNSHRGRAYFACIDWETGDTEWATPEFGYGSLCAAADGRLIVLGARGMLAVGKASPTGWKATSQAQVLGGLCWTPPVLANGHLFCRNSRGDLVRLSLNSASE